MDHRLYREVAQSHRIASADESRETPSSAAFASRNCSVAKRSRVNSSSETFHRAAIAKRVRRKSYAHTWFIPVGVSGRVDLAPREGEVGALRDWADRLGARGDARCARGGPDRPRPGGVGDLRPALACALRLALVISLSTRSRDLGSIL